MNYENIQNELVSFLKNSLKETNCESFIVGLSGGIDSAVSLTLCSLVKDIKTYAFLMPTSISNKNNLEDAIQLCKKLGIEYEILNIENILDSYKLTLKNNLNKIRQGNLSARIRMSILYDKSAQLNGCVVGTSNLSERMLGYFTIFGDGACAFNPIGEFFKSDLFEFAKFLKIDEKFIKKAPSADLYDGQTDEDEFGFSYKQIDQVLKKIYFGNASNDELYKDFPKNLVDFILNKIEKNSFKLNQPKVAKIIYN